MAHALRRFPGCGSLLGALRALKAWLGAPQSLGLSDSAMDLANKVAAMAKRTLPVSGVFDEVRCPACLLPPMAPPCRP